MSVKFTKVKCPLVIKSGSSVVYTSPELTEKARPLPAILAIQEADSLHFEL